MLFCQNAKVCCNSLLFLLSCYDNFSQFDLSSVLRLTPFVQIFIVYSLFFSSLRGSCRFALCFNPFRVKERIQVKGMPTTGRVLLGLVAEWLAGVSAHFMFSPCNAENENPSHCSTTQRKITLAPKAPKRILKKISAPGNTGKPGGTRSRTPPSTRRVSVFMCRPALGQGKGTPKKTGRLKAFSK